MVLIRTGNMNENTDEAALALAHKSVTFSFFGAAVTIDFQRTTLFAQ